MAPVAAPPNPSAEAPLTSATPLDERTPLQKHVGFFDTDDDGIIWPLDTFFGFRLLGFDLINSFISMIVIHLGMSYVTQDSWIPDPFFRIRIAYIHKAKHGSSSLVYDRRGLFTPENMDEIFKAYSEPPNYDTLTFWQAMAVARGNRDPFDFFGWIANPLEWFSLYMLLWPKDGKMKKEDIRGMYDGSLFHRIANQNRKRNGTFESKTFQGHVKKR